MILKKALIFNDLLENSSAVLLKLKCLKEKNWLFKSIEFNKLNKPNDTNKKKEFFHSFIFCIISLLGSQKKRRVIYQTK